MNSRLRTVAILVLANRGFAGPNYSLDDIDPLISYSEISNSFAVNFWDMSTIVNEGDQYYDELMEFYKNNNNEFFN